MWNCNSDRRLSNCSSMMKQCWILVISCVIFAGLSESRNDDLSIPRNPSIGIATASHQVKGTFSVCGRGEFVCESMVNTNQYDGLSKIRTDDMSIPSNLLIGASSASYQVEGAWNVSGKGESVWDRMVHTQPKKILDGTNGDIACDSYHKYKEDVQLMRSIGLQVYRFSISWARILNPGRGNQINEAGLQYYKNLVTELVKNNIQPIVTIFHWDHPQYLEDMGGWTNELIIDYFLLYARILFKELGDKVKIWQTMNEPNTFCGGAYRGDEQPHLAPDKSLNVTGMYLCMHNILKAHALVYHMYDREFRPTQRGQVAIGAGCMNYVGVDNDTVSAETAFQFECGWVFHPVYNGDYPEVMKKREAMVSKDEGFERSRLPEFSKEWIDIIKGTSDFLSVNHYTTLLVRPGYWENPWSFNRDAGLVYSFDSEWPLSTTAPWLCDVPWGLGDVLRWIKKEYNNPPVRIMENGWADAGELDDYGRIQYYYGYIKSLLEAVKEDHCNVQSYAVWSLTDTFEWNAGYTSKMGIVGVDFNDTARTRREKLSTAWWRKVIETRKLQPVPTKP